MEEEEMGHGEGFGRRREGGMSAHREHSRRGLERGEEDHEVRSRAGHIEVGWRRRAGNEPGVWWGRQCGKVGTKVAGRRRERTMSAHRGHPRCGLE